MDFFVVGTILASRVYMRKIPFLNGLSFFSSKKLTKVPFFLGKIAEGEKFSIFIDFHLQLSYSNVDSIPLFNKSLLVLA